MTVDRVRSMLPDSGEGIERAIPLVQELVGTVRTRAERAETRAAVIIGVTGILAGLVLDYAGRLRDPNVDGWWILGGLLLAILILLLKAILHCLRAFDALRGLELSPEAGLEISGMTKREAERAELAGRIWEYYHLLRVSNARLYYSQRGQKNLVLAIVVWSVTAIGARVLSLEGVRIPTRWEIASAVVAVAFALVADRASERLAGLWKR